MSSSSHTFVVFSSRSNGWKPSWLWQIKIQRKISLAPSSSCKQQIFLTKDLLFYSLPGKTYDQITRLLQGYIENEVDMNPDGTCRENCPYYTLTRNYGCFKDQFCAKQTPCKGRIIDCQYIDSDMMVCPASVSRSLELIHLFQCIVLNLKQSY